MAIETSDELISLLCRAGESKGKEKVGGREGGVEGEGENERGGE